MTDTHTTPYIPDAVVREAPVNIDKLIAELKSAEDMCFSWSGSALLANELNATDTDEGHISLYKDLCGLGNAMSYLQSELRALSAEPAQGEQWQPTHRHVKRGTEYQLIGTGKMQAEKWYEYPCERPVNSIDMQEVAIYRGDDGQLWVRPVAEFNDGRFEILPAAPTTEAGK